MCGTLPRIPSMGIKAHSVPWFQRESQAKPTTRLFRRSAEIFFGKDHLYWFEQAIPLGVEHIKAATINEIGGTG
jgi:hypothetical protein